MIKSRKISFNKDNYYLSANWNEMETKDLITLSKLVMEDRKKHSILFKLALSMMGLSMAYRYQVKLSDDDNDDYYVIRRGLRRRYLVTPAQMAVVVSELSFIFDTDMVSPKFVHNPLRKISIATKKYHGPADGLTNITLGEFIQAEIERAAYETSKKDDHLNRFLAILWRPCGDNHPDGDPRAPLCQDDIDRRARKMAWMKPHIKQVMMWFYQGTLNFMYKKFDLVFSSGSEGDNSTTFDNFMNMVNLLSAGDLSKFKSVREAPLYDALYNLQEIMESKEKTKS